MNWWNAVVAMTTRCYRKTRSSAQRVITCSVRNACADLQRKSSVRYIFNVVKYQASYKIGCPSNASLALDWGCRRVSLCFSVVAGRGGEWLKVGGRWRENNEVVECGCCYDDEVLLENTLTCADGARAGRQRK